MNDGGYVFQSCMCLYIAAVCVGGVLHPTRLCKTCINTTPSAAMYNRRKKAKLVISRRNWVVVGGGTEDFAWFTSVVPVFLYSWQVNACPDSKNWPKREEMVTRSQGNIKKFLHFIKGWRKMKYWNHNYRCQYKAFQDDTNRMRDRSPAYWLWQTGKSMAGKKPKLHYKPLNGSGRL